MRQKPYVCSIFVMGPKRDCVGRVRVGCVARNDANVWFLPHLRREGGLLCRADASSRLRAVRNLVWNGCPSLAAANDRHSGNLLFRRRTFHSASTSLSSAARAICIGAGSLSRVSCKLRLDVVERKTTKSGKARTLGHEHLLLVVLQ